MLMALACGLLAGFFGSIPIAGPTAVVIVERALAGRALAAFEIAVGAAVAELAYACCAYLGMTAFLTRFPRLVLGSRVLGAVILIGLGIYLALARRKPPSDAAKQSPRRGTPGAMFMLGLVMTGMNPTLLASWSAVVTVLHSTGWLRVHALDAIPFALGVGVGSTGWFAILLAILHRHHRKLSEKTMARIVKGIGWALVAGGIAVSVGLIRSCAAPG